MARNFEPQDIAGKYRRVLEASAQATAAHKALDNITKTVLAKIILKHRPSCNSHAESETRALADPDYEKHLKELAEAHELASVARARAVSFEAYIELLRSANATDRAEMNLR